MPVTKWCVLGLLLSASTAACDDWARFRGPNGSGVSIERTATPITWSATENLKWKVALPGLGVSSPIVVGDRVFVTCFTGYGVDRDSVGELQNLKRHLLCFDRDTGEQQWEAAVATVPGEDPFTGEGIPEHGYASHTPVSDGERVYVFFGKAGVVAFDMNGKELWKTDVGKGSDPRKWGSASSPILYKELLIVTAGAESEAIIALDTENGNEVWRQEASGLRGVWGTPVLADVSNQRTDLVIGAPYELWGFNPETGELRWYCGAVSTPIYLSSVVEHGGMVFAIEGQSGDAFAVKAGGEGDVSKPVESKGDPKAVSQFVWKSSVGGAGTDYRFATPIVYDGRVYSFASSVVTCLNAADGTKVFQSPLETANPYPSPSSDKKDRTNSKGFTSDFASPIVADGKIYYTRRSGDTYVLEPGATLKVLAINRVTSDEEVFGATPAISRGELFIRSDKHLYCISGER
jgi:outer membrane protein assembly factor BamB